MDQIVTVMAILLVLSAAVLCGCVGQSPTTVHETTSYSGKITQVKILPVFFVPADGKEPRDAEIQLLNKHLLIAQSRYKAMIKDRDIFGIISDPPVIYKSPNNLWFFRKSADRGGTKYTLELLQHLNVSRYDCPYILLIVVMNPTDNFPYGGGRTINGGIGNGGGIVIMSSYLLNQPDGGFQSTLQHELGHSFGLLHADAYGYDMNTSKSIMSYNPNNNWRGFEPPASEGILIPEDLYALAKNKLVFPNFYFDPVKDVPAGYQLNKLIDSESQSPMDFTTDHFGYELFFDGKPVGHEPDWSFRQAMENLLVNIKRYPEKKVEGRYEGGKILISGTGYELYFFGERVGHEPYWGKEQALKNLQWNIKNHLEQEVVGIYNMDILS